jgi:hypothetical protein
MTFDFIFVHQNNSRTSCLFSGTAIIASAISIAVFSSMTKHHSLCPTVLFHGQAVLMNALLPTLGCSIAKFLDRIPKFEHTMYVSYNISIGKHLHFNGQVSKEFEK